MKFDVRSAECGVPVRSAVCDVLVRSAECGGIVTAFIGASLALLVVAGCDGVAETPAKAPPPATVANPVTEGNLSTIT